jgi:hypothetical protein
VRRKTWWGGRLISDPTEMEFRLHTLVYFRPQGARRGNAHTWGAADGCPAETGAWRVDVGLPAMMREGPLAVARVEHVLAGLRRVLLLDVRRGVGVHQRLGPTKQRAVSRPLQTASCTANPCCEACWLRRDSGSDLVATSQTRPELKPPMSYRSPGLGMHTSNGAHQHCRDARNHSTTPVCLAHARLRASRPCLNDPCHASSR